MKGLLKNLTLRNSVVVAFWKITSINMEFPAKYAIVRLGGYASEAAYDAAPESPIVSTYAECLAADFDKYFASAKLSPVGKDPEANSYAWLKTLKAMRGIDGKLDLTTGVTNVP